MQIGTDTDIYPLYLKMLVSGSLSDSSLRRIFLLRVTPLKRNATQSMISLAFPKGLV
jgi:hypothetical protein